MSRTDSRVAFREDPHSSSGTHARKYHRDPCRLSFAQRACSQASTQVNMMFVMLLWVCIHNRQAEKFASQRWESQRSRVRFPPWSGIFFSLPGVDAHSEYHHKNDWMRLSVISKIIKAEVCVIHRSWRLIYHSLRAGSLDEREPARIPITFTCMRPIFGRRDLIGW
jgi:hypothetical protein